MIRKFTPRHGTFEAVRWDGRVETAELLESWSYHAIQCHVDSRDHISSKLFIRGGCAAAVGDYIVRMSCGQYIPMSAQQFVKSYEPLLEVTR
jgi:hypothetical protein